MWRSPRAEGFFLADSFDFARFGRAQPPWPPAPMSASGIRRKPAGGSHERLVRRNCVPRSRKRLGHWQGMVS
jgi:hypothetical protein